MNQTEEQTLVKYCKSVQQDDWCFYINDYLPQFSICALGVTQDYGTAVKQIRLWKNNIESNGHLFFCHDEQTAFDVCNAVISFLSFDCELDNENEYVWLEIDPPTLESALFKASHLFKDKAFRFSQTAFINEAFVLHKISDWNDKTYWPTIPLRSKI